MTNEAFRIYGLYGNNYIFTTFSEKLRPKIIGLQVI